MLRRTSCYNTHESYEQPIKMRHMSHNYMSGGHVLPTPRGQVSNLSSTHKPGEERLRNQNISRSMHNQRVENKFTKHEGLRKEYYK